MKRLSKMLAVSMALALTLGMTAFAAGSTSTTNTNITNTVLEKQAEATKAVTADGKTSIDVKAVDVTVYDAAAAAGNAEGVVGSTVKVDAILAVVDVQGPEGGAEVTIENAAIKADGKYVLLHQKKDGSWEKIDATKIEAGKITAKFSSFSAVAIVEISQKAGAAPAAAPAATDAAASPKTGETLPVAGIALLICLAGAAVCAKKVKFNR